MKQLAKLRRRHVVILSGLAVVMVVGALMLHHFGPLAPPMRDKKPLQPARGIASSLNNSQVATAEPAKPEAAKPKQDAKTKAHGTTGVLGATTSDENTQPKVNPDIKSIPKASPQNLPKQPGTNLLTPVTNLLEGTLKLLGLVPAN